MEDKLKAVEDYLHSHIPISKAMGVTAVHASDNRVVLRAPLDLNINHKSTAFGGSLQALATLSCWTLLHINLRHAANAGEIVITSSNINYIRPVTQDFEAEATLPEGNRWPLFLKTFDRHGKARIQLTASIVEDDELAIDYTGSFAALKS
ncbi:YiiD C-terminal domain-containing protein [Kordiimonas gwangyangensis]|uniref:YiiD C-terminal domain-containing protein n=1 Tax=Kordiimonas gwangyangensis TaxID=288022 RepID=UPI00036B868E|nr:YiiD C-terminal domain-containing protein [Kordiimonas gwangyangensis]